MHRGKIIVVGRENQAGKLNPDNPLGREMTVSTRRLGELPNGLSGLNGYTIFSFRGPIEMFIVNIFGCCMLRLILLFFGWLWGIAGLLLGAPCWLSPKWFVIALNYSNRSVSC